MNITTFTSILLTLIFFMILYVVFTGSMSGTTKLIMIVFLAFLGIYLVSTFSLFKNYSTILSNPQKADSSYSYKSEKVTYNDKEILQQYTFSIWMYISDWNKNIGMDKNIFSIKSTNRYLPQAYLDEYENKVIVKYYVNKDDSSPEEITIELEDISIQKWVNLTVCFNTNNVDCYINGKLRKTKYDNKPLVSSLITDIVLCENNNGFSGEIANDKFYERSLNPQEVWDIYREGYNNSLFSRLLNRYQAKFIFLKDGELKNSYTIL